MHKTKTLILSSNEFKKFFLLKFTEQLIRNSGEKEIFELKSILKKQEKVREEQSKERVREVIKKIERKERGNEFFEKLIVKNEEPAELTPPITNMHSLVSEIQTTTPQIIQKPRVLSAFAPSHGFFKIPEIRLPPRLQYLKPYPTNIRIDLGKLNTLIDDRAVSSIECHGYSENIVVIGKMGTKKTNIILTKEEIDDVINKFSTTAKIPVQEGVFKVVVGTLILSAVISDIISTRFIIRKMPLLMPPPISPR